MAPRRSRVLILNADVPRHPLIGHKVVMHHDQRFARTGGCHYHIAVVGRSARIGALPWYFRAFQAVRGGTVAREATSVDKSIRASDGGDSDPVQAITERAQAKVVAAIQNGWKGPPYDPFALAEYLRVTVIAREDILEARTVPARGGYSIEFNPNRPRNRVKYSICHELAHTLFPDCAERVRNRVTHRDMKGDEWQLEMLCNIGAAEMLMPVGSTPSTRGWTIHD